MPVSELPPTEQMVGTLRRPWLRKTALFVPHERIADCARSLGIAEVIVSGAGDEAMVDAMVRFFAPAPSNGRHERAAPERRSGADDHVSDTIHR